jgi:hypothetical protein
MAQQERKITFFDYVVQDMVERELTLHQDSTMDMLSISDDYGYVRVPLDSVVNMIAAIIDMYKYRRGGKDIIMKEISEKL